MNKLRNQSTIELIKLLWDGNWYCTNYLVLAAGKYIPPEVASRRRVTQGHRQTIEYGRFRIIRTALDGLVRNARAERRHINRTSEWRLVDYEWARKMFEYSGEPLPTPSEVKSSSVPPISVPTISVPTMKKVQEKDTTIHIKPAEFKILSDAKLAYERVNGKIGWGSFLMLLLGNAIGHDLLQIHVTEVDSTDSRAIESQL